MLIYPFALAFRPLALFPLFGSASTNPESLYLLPRFWARGSATLPAPLTESSVPEADILLFAEDTSGL